MTVTVEHWGHGNSLGKLKNLNDKRCAERKYVQAYVHKGSDRCYTSITYRTLSKRLR